MTDAALAELRIYVWAWLAMATIVLWRHSRNDRSVGLVACFVLSLGSMHWLASALLLLPWREVQAENLEFTAIGMRLSTIAMLALLIGAEVGGMMRPTRGGDASAPESGKQLVPPRLVTLYLIGGAVMYLLLFTAAGRIPSVRSVVSMGSSLIAVGVGLKCWNAWHLGHKWTERWWLLSTLGFPVLTVVVQGFLGYGFATMMVVLAFRASFHRIRVWHLAVGAVMAFAGLSVYVTYMRERAEIREIVWSGGAMRDRTAKLGETVRSFETFDVRNEEHLRRVNVRLNQNYLVGAAVVHLEGGVVPYANGATLLEAAAAVIPRMLWPDKPITAGSGELVSIYTGFRFDSDTSVGVGQVMEYYINFGTSGVFLGFILIGALLVTSDRSASFHLARGDSHKFLIWYLPALSLLNIGGSFTEVTAGAAAAYVLCLSINWVADQVLPSGERFGRQLESSTLPTSVG
ncbi:MAG: hypothetical protein ACRD2N_06875 [Vicinamibacterales bacterium]